MEADRPISFPPLTKGGLGGVDSRCPGTCATQPFRALERTLSFGHGRLVAVVVVRRSYPALKGRHKTAPGAVVSPFQGSEVRGCRVPGAVPRAGLLRPLRGEIVPSQSASNEVRSRAVTFPLAWTDLGAPTIGVFLEAPWAINNRSK